MIARRPDEGVSLPSETLLFDPPSSVGFADTFSRPCGRRMLETCVILGREKRESGMRRDWRAKQKWVEPKRIPRGALSGRRMSEAFDGRSGWPYVSQTGLVVRSRGPAPRFDHQRRWVSGSALAPDFTFPADAQTKHLLHLDPQTYRLS